jgi:DNA-binding protein YbaB
MVSFSQMKDMYRLQREAKKIKQELSKIYVEAEASGVKVVVNAEQEVISVEIADTVDRARIPELIKDAMNRALKKAQVVAAEKMQGIMGQMGLPTENAA